MLFKSRTGVGFALRSDCAVGGDTLWGDGRVAMDNGTTELCQSEVLTLGVGVVVATVELNTNAKIIATLAPFVARNARVPCAFEGGNKLCNVAVASDIKVCRNFEVGNFFKIRVRLLIVRQLA